ncbi:MAG: hypothetical protein JST47_09805 [Bacteroidetes bacterium]|nr:hypothetical protein [Bacteroidota bacterium]MBS1973134.1 hypothetical protein [Bacteroidota bacterium]
MKPFWQKACTALLIIGYSFITIVAHAQSDSTSRDTIDNSIPKTSYFNFMLSYSANDVYYGRKDSLPVPYFSPSLQYVHKSGIYLKATASYLASSYAQRIDAVELEGGYNFAIGENFSGTLKADKYYYNSASVSVRSEIKSVIGAELSYDCWGIVGISGNFMYSFTSGPSDFLINPGISHEFDWGTNGAWSLEPGFAANIGTTHFHDAYKQRRFLKNGKSVNKNDSTVTETSTEKIVTATKIYELAPGHLKVLDYEFSIPLNYNYKKWTFSCTPYYAIPVNPATYLNQVNIKTTPKGGATSSTTSTFKTTETLSNSFYVEAALSFRLDMKKNSKTPAADL